MVGKSKFAPSDEKFQALKIKAADIFVDREKPKAAFDRVVREFCASSPRRFRLLTFYGAGGQGKTALCTELQRILSESPLKDLGCRAALIDLHVNKPGDYVHALVSIRNAIADATGARFACFDLALTDYCDQLGIHKPQMVIGARRFEGFTGDIRETGADAVAGAAKEVFEGLLKEGVGEAFTDVVGGVPIVGPSLKRMTKWAFSEGTAAYLRARSPVMQSLYGADGGFVSPKMIMEHLADILAHEFGLFLKSKPGLRVALFIDEYENAIPLGGSKSSIQASSPWDDGLREFISRCATGHHQPKGRGEAYAYEAEFLLLIFGREKLRWDLFDPGWSEDLKEQHMLGGLSDTDAQEFLQKAGVDSAEIRDAIVASARAPDPESGAVAAFPIMLDLGMQIYFDIKSNGETPVPADFSVKGQSYVARRRDLFTRFMRNFQAHPGLEGLLRRLACTREFTRELVAHLSSKFALGFDMLHFTDLTALSFVGPAADGGAWVMHTHIRETLLDTLLPEDVRETHACLAAWFTERGTPVRTRDILLDHAEALGDAMVHLAEAVLPLDGFRSNPSRREVMNWLPAQSRLREPGRFALEIRRRKQPENHPDIAGALNILAAIYLLEEELVEAERYYQEALSIRRSSLPADHLDIATSLRNLALVWYRQDRFEEARRVCQDSLDIQRAQLPQDDPLITENLTSLGAIAYGQGHRDEAQRLFTEALTLQRASLPPGHRDLAIAMSGVAVGYFDAGDLAEAQRLFEEKLSIDKNTLPDGHLDIAGTLESLGAIQFIEGNFAGAAELYREALEIQRGSVTPGHPLVAGTKARLYQSTAALRLELAQARRPSATDASAPPVESSFLSFDREAAWALPPLHSTGWLTDDDRLDKRIVDYLDSWFRKTENGREVPFSSAYGLRRLRHLALPFWGVDSWLVEGQVSIDGEPALFSGFWDHDVFTLCHGESLPIHQRNQREPIDLSTVELRLAYRSFFCSWVHGENGRFALIRTVDDLTPFVADPLDRAALFNLVQQSEHDQLAEGQADAWSSTAHIVYDHALFRAEFLIRASGEVEMVGDEPIGSEIALRPERWNGPFRSAGPPLR